MKLNAEKNIWNDTVDIHITHISKRNLWYTYCGVCATVFVAGLVSISNKIAE